MKLVRGTQTMFLCQGLLWNHCRANSNGGWEGFIPLLYNNSRKCMLMFVFVALFASRLLDNDCSRSIP